jgi:hypothetical protein
MAAVRGRRSPPPSQGVSRSLVDRAFPPGARPAHLASDAFYRFTPAADFLSLPGDVARTEFRLAAAHAGWEYGLLRRDLGDEGAGDRPMLVTVWGGGGVVGRRKKGCARPTLSLSPTGRRVRVDRAHGGVPGGAPVHGGVPHRVRAQGQGGRERREGRSGGARGVLARRAACAHPPSHAPPPTLQSFLDDACTRLAADPDAFQGLL